MNEGEEGEREGGILQFVDTYVTSHQTNCNNHHQRENRCNARASEKIRSGRRQLNKEKKIL